jgi:hypothetical protein
MGWSISVYKRFQEELLPATAQSPPGKQLVEWEIGLWGLEGMFALVKAGKAIDLGCQGLLWKFTATAENLLPWVIEQMAKRPRSTNPQLMWDSAGVFGAEWEGKTMADFIPAVCRSDEWLIVEAWDMS